MFTFTGGLLRRRINNNIAKYILIFAMVIGFSAYTFADDTPPPCHNTNGKNYCGALKFDNVLNGSVNLVNGNFIKSWQDMYIPGRGSSLEIKRTYNSQIGTAVKDWFPESGTWNIENGEYSGEGDRTVLGARIKGMFVITLKMKTVQQGEHFPYETAWVNFCYTDKDNRYAFLINTNGDLELVRYKNGIATGRVRSASSVNPLQWNTIRIERGAIVPGQPDEVLVTVNNSSNTSVWLVDQDPLPDAFLCLEAYFCHAHFDDVNVSVVGTGSSITYETPTGPVFSQRQFDNPYADTGTISSNQLTYDFNFTTDDEKSIFGYGWTWNYGMKIQPGPGGALIVVYPDRHVDTYTKNSGGTYSAPKGVYHTLTSSINESDHSKDSFTLKEKYGTTYNFDPYGRLANIIDRNSNQLTFTYNNNDWGQLTEISDASGRKLTFHYNSNHKVDYIDDPAARRVKYDYDSNGNLIKLTDPMNNFITYTYYVNYNLKDWTDKEGHTYENSYYYNDRLKTQKDPLGNITTYEYTWDQTTVTNSRTEAFVYTFDDKNRLKWAKDPYGNMEGYAWDDFNNKIGVTDKLGNTTNFEYDASGNQTRLIRKGANGLDDIVSVIAYEPIFNQPTKITDALGNVTEFTYDLKGNLTSSVKYLNQSGVVQNVRTEITYDSYGQPTNTKDALGNITISVYDGYGNITSTTDALNNKTAFTYDNLSRLLTKIDPKGNTTAYTYDNNNNVLTATNALLQKITNTYDKDGRLLTSTDPNNQVTVYQYDVLGNVIKTIDALGNFSNSIYDCANYMRQNQVNLTSLTDANGHITTYGYDMLGRLTNVTDPLGNKTQKQYDAVGNVTATIDANSHTTTNIYDCFYRKTSTIDPLGRKAQFSYDKMGNIIKVIDPNNHSTGYEYDTLYRKAVVYDALNNSISYGYDKLGNLIWTRDAKGNVINMQYDALSRKIDMQDPDMGHWTYQYDANGNLTKQTDAKVQVLEFTYDALNRVLTKKANGQTTVTYTYDDPLINYSKGRLTKVVDTNSKTEFFYDALGRQIKTTKTIDSAPYTVQRSYDKKGNLNTLTYPDSETVVYTYDNADNIKRIAGNSVYVSNVNYTPTNQIQETDYGNSVITKYSYYYDNRLKTIQTKKDTTILQDLSYSFDSIGNVSSISDASHTNSQSFKYDELNRLIEATGSYGTRDYAYDSIGNMVLKDFVNYSYGQNQSNPHALTAGSDGTVCEYDSNGNMTRKNEQLYQYDAENRLIKVTRNVTNLATASMHLTPGWNFMSLPVKPDDNKISSVLNGLTPGTDYDQVSRFNPVSQKFQNFVNDKQFNQFDKFDFGLGYQIYVKNPSGIDITVQGKSPDRKFSIFSGWNEIGATSAVSQTQALFLANLQDGVDVNQLSWYNFSINQYQAPSSIDSGKAYFINGLRQSSWYIQQQNAQLETLAQYFYDGDGGRIKKVTPNATTTYIGSLFEKTATTTTKHIFMGPNRICSVSSTSDKSFYHSDHLGSSNIITNQAGNLIQNCEYLPYGEFSTKIGVAAMHYYFTGKELDDETGLMFYGARYYDPQLGRFITADTVVQAPYDPQSLNRYSYCRNNPINLTDPTGHKNIFKKIGDWFSDVAKDIGSFFEKNWQYVVTAAMIAITVVTFGATAPITIGMITGCITGGISAYQAGGNVGNGMLFGAVIGGITGAAAGGFKDYFLESVFKNQIITPMEGGLITSGEFAIGGFGAGVISGYAGGKGDFEDMMKGGLIGAGIGAATGFAVGYSYTAGWQSVMHGANTQEHNQYVDQLKKVSSSLTVPVQEQLKSTQPVFGKGVEWNKPIDFSGLGDYWENEFQPWLEDKGFGYTPADIWTIIETARNLGI